MSVINSDLKNIVDEWVNTNSDDLVKGLEIKSPKELLDYERKLLSHATWRFNHNLDFEYKTSG